MAGRLDRVDDVLQSPAVNVQMRKPLEAVEGRPSWYNVYNTALYSEEQTERSRCARKHSTETLTFFVCWHQAPVDGDVRKDEYRALQDKSAVP